MNTKQTEPRTTKLTDAAVEQARTQGGAVASQSAEREGEGGVRCSALLGDGSFRGISLLEFLQAVHKDAEDGPLKESLARSINTMSRDGYIPSSSRSLRYGEFEPKGLALGDSETQHDERNMPCPMQQDSRAEKES